MYFKDMPRVKMEEPLKNTKGNVEDLSSGMEGDNRSTKNTDKQIQWRRTKVL